MFGCWFSKYQKLSSRPEVSDSIGLISGTTHLIIIKVHHPTLLPGEIPDFRETSPTVIHLNLGRKQLKLNSD